MPLSAQNSSPAPQIDSRRTPLWPPASKTLLFRPIGWGRTTTLLVASSLIALVALIDWCSADDVPLGFMYLFPMLLLGRLLKPWQSFLAASVCTVLTEVFDPFAWNLRTGVPRDILYFMAFFAIAIFNFQVSRSREKAALQLQRIESEAAARLQAEQQLLSLVETSPAAIITTGMDGAILMANGAAHRLLDVPTPGLLGRSLHGFFPSLANVTKLREGDQLFRTVMQSHGRRASGSGFLAEICFSTYRTTSGVLFTGMILDSSEEFRSREESSLHQMLLGSRIALGAMSHEVRNLCGAIAAVHRNLSNAVQLTGNKDMEALRNLVGALERIAAIELKPGTESLSPVDLGAILDDVRIVIGPTLEENHIALKWRVASDFPLVWADGTNLMQVLLNLTTNSIRALNSNSREGEMTIEATHRDGKAFVSVIDNAGGVKNSDHLFRPFQSGAENVGLGLYLAKAFARSFSGDLVYSATGDGARFTVELHAVQDGALL